MKLRRQYHILLYEAGSKRPSFVANPLYWYPTLDAARTAAHAVACTYDRGAYVDVLKDAEVVERVASCAD